MAGLSSPSIEERLPAMAAVIHQAIPGSEVRLFGSRARGQAGPDSDIDLLITAPNSWLQEHQRFEVLNALWDQLARPMFPLICCSIPRANATSGATGAAM